MKPPARALSRYRPIILTYVALAKIARPLRRMPAYANQPQERKPGRGGSDMDKSLLYDERKTCNGSLGSLGSHS